jgi:hypothetical protein
MSRTGVNTGDVIRLPGWTTTVTINPAAGETLQIAVAGVEEDENWSDSLGSVNVEYDQRSTPSWGIRTHQETSSNRSFRVDFRIASLNVEY